MFTCPDRLETNKRNLHTCECTDRVPSGICDVESAGVSTHEKENERVQRDHVGDEDISTCGDHINLGSGKHQENAYEPHAATM